MEISSNKPKKNKSILKPALSLIESFRRTNKRKSTKKNKATPEKLNLLETQTTRTTRSNVPVTKENFRKIPHEGNQQSITDASVETERLQITASQDVELSKSTTLNADKVEIKTGTEGIEFHSVSYGPATSSIKLDSRIYESFCEYAQPARSLVLQFFVSPSMMITV